MRRTSLAANLAPALMLILACSSSTNGTTVTVLGYTVVIQTTPPTTAEVGTSVPVAFTVNANESDGSSKPASGSTFNPSNAPAVIRSGSTR